MKNVVHKAHRRSGFATVSLNCLEDPRLPAVAKMVHTYAISRPEGWELRMTDLMRRFREGERAIYSAFRKLEDIGYLRREQSRGRQADGRMCFGEVTYHWYEKPLDDDDLSLPDEVSPVAETAVAETASAQTVDAETAVISINLPSINHPSINQLISIEQRNTDQEPEVRVDEYTKDFEEFWKLYPRKDGKKETWRCWKALIKDGKQPDVLLSTCKHYARYVRQMGTADRYVMLPSTFLGPDQRYEEWMEARRPRTTSEPECRAASMVSDASRELYRKAIHR